MMAGLLLALAAAWLVRVPAGSAQTPPTGAAPAGAVQEGPAEARLPVQELYAALRGEMESGGSFRQRFDRLAPVIDRVLDIDAILRTSVGPRWSALSEAAQHTLSTVFRTFTIASYTANFSKENGERFEVAPQTRMSGANVIVETRLIPRGEDPVRIDYVMARGPSNWAVVDVLLDGSISRVAVQRSDFRALLASGDPAPLINSLKKKISDLSGGTLQDGS